MSSKLSPAPIVSGPTQRHWLPLSTAIQEVAAFERRFGEKHLLLACQVA